MTLKPVKVEEIVFTARPKINSHSQIFRYGRSIFCLPHRSKFSDFFDLCLHWVSVVRGLLEVAQNKLAHLRSHVQETLQLKEHIASHDSHYGEMKRELLSPILFTQCTSVTILIHPSRLPLRKAHKKPCQGAFTYDVRCFWVIFDLPTYPNQISSDVA